MNLFVSLLTLLWKFRDSDRRQSVIWQRLLRVRTPRRNRCNNQNACKR